MFVGHPAPPGSREVQAPNGNIVRTGPDGAVMDVRNPRNNMSIHHAPDGSRQITVDRPDGSRIFAASHGASYVQHPYQFQKSTFDSRTYYQGGKITQQFYRRYTYGGTTLDAYVPQRFYDPRIYQWALNSNFREPMIPSWNFVATPTPWFNYYKSYFTPQPYYTNALTWLTDYLIANSLVAAWNAHGPASSTPLAPAPAFVAANSPTPPASAQSAAAGNAQAPAAPAASAAAEVTPETKQKVTEEVSRQISEESAESRENAQHKEPQPGTVGIVAELSRRGEEHVFVVASDLDLVDDQARRCTMSEGDVVQAISGPDPATASAQAKVLASKGQGECERAAQVTIALTDLQDMQNHMRETIDQGLADRTGMKGVQATTAAGRRIATAGGSRCRARNRTAEENRRGRGLAHRHLPRRSKPAQMPLSRPRAPRDRRLIPRPMKSCFRHSERPAAPPWPPSGRRAPRRCDRHGLRARQRSRPDPWPRDRRSRARASLPL
jgi:hypothetical protein